MTKAAYEFWLSSEEVEALLPLLEAHKTKPSTLDRLYQQLTAIDQDGKDWQANYERLNPR